MEKHFIPFHRRPTATTNQNRIPMFAARKTIKDNQALDPATIKNGYGECTFSGVRLSQRHKDLLEAVLTYHSDAEAHSTGEVTYYINSYKIMKKMGLRHSDTTWLEKMCEDLRIARVTCSRDGSNEVSGIISCYHWEAPEMTIGDDGKFTRGYFGIRVSKQFLHAFNNEVNVFYPKLVEKVLAIDSPLTKAVVRFFLTHSPSTKMQRVNLLKVMGEQDPQQYKGCVASVEDKKALKACEKKWRRKIAELDANEDILKSFGIIFDGICYHYTQHEKVWFRNPAQARWDIESSDEDNESSDEDIQSSDQDIESSDL